MIKYILVTGGAGFIGSHLVKYLLKKGFNVISVDNYSTGKIENLPINPKLIKIKLDVTNKNGIQDLFKKFHIIRVFHLAAIASVKASVENPLSCYQTNFESTLYLLESCKKVSNFERFIFASSAAVYGDDPIIPKKEHDVINPLTPYAIDKYSSERYVLSYSNLYNLPTTAVRFFNVFGENQNPDSEYSGVISIFKKKFDIAEDTVNINIYGDGKQTRDFVYIEDVIQACLIVAEQPYAIGNVFNVGTGVQINLLEVVQSMSEVTGKKYTLNFLPERKGDIRNSLSDINKIEMLGYKASFTFKEGLNKYFLRELSNNLGRQV